MEDKTLRNHNRKKPLRRMEIPGRWTPTHWEVPPREALLRYETGHLVAKWGTGVVPSFVPPQIIILITQFVQHSNKLSPTCAEQHATQLSNTIPNPLQIPREQPASQHQSRTEDLLFILASVFRQHVVPAQSTNNTCAAHTEAKSFIISNWDIYRRI